MTSSIKSRWNRADNTPNPMVDQPARQTTIHIGNRRARHHPNATASRATTSVRPADLGQRPI
jgi:hypothetical protein